MTQEHLFKKAEPEKEPVLTTREISKLVNYYLKNVRLHSVQERQGVIKNIQRILEGKPGREPISPQDIADALKNYANDEFTKSLPQQQRKHIRSFFTYENLLVWRRPAVRKPVRRDNSLNALEQLETVMKPRSLPQPPSVEEEPEEAVEF